VKYSFQNLFEIVLERFIHLVMRFMAAVFDGCLWLFTGKFRKKERLLMINSYLGNVCSFPLVTRNVKEELNMSTTPAD
jgi:hypothetical protein